MNLFRPAPSRSQDFHTCGKQKALDYFILGMLREPGAGSWKKRSSRAFSTVTRRHARGHGDRKFLAASCAYQTRRPTHREATTAPEGVSTASGRRGISSGSPRPVTVPRQLVQKQRRRLRCRENFLPMLLRRDAISWNILLRRRCQVQSKRQSTPVQCK